MNAAMIPKPMFWATGRSHAHGLFEVVATRA